VRLQSAWGTLTVTAVPQGAHVSVDGVDGGPAPATIAAASGVRRIRIAAQGWKTWESSVVLRGGQALAVGPVTLGQPDAHLSVRSAPAGADVTIAGTHRGRAPLAVELPAGIAYPVLVSLPGYAVWTQEVFAAVGSQPECGRAAHPRIRAREGGRRARRRRAARRRRTARTDPRSR